MKKEFREYLIQILLIVFSVVLGLYLNEKIVQHNEKKEAEKLLSFVKTEINANRFLLKDWAPYHREISIKLDSLSKEEQFVSDFIKDKNILFSKLMTRRTFMNRNVSDDAWEISKGNPILVNIGFERMLLLSKIYSQQDGTFKPSSEMFKVLQSRGVNDPSSAKENLSILNNHMRELVGREFLLQQYYEEAAEEFQLPDEPKETKTDNSDIEQK